MKSEPGFTKFDNFFLDRVMPKAGLAEWKVICAVIRETVGWHRTDAEMSIDQIMARTGLASQAVVTGIKNACKRQVIKRRAQQAGKQRSFRYSADPRANLKDVPKPDPRRHQESLPFMSDGENHNPFRMVKIKIPNAISDGENQNPTGPLLRSEKKDQDLKKHTVSEFSEEERKQHAVNNRLGPGWLVNSVDGRYDEGIRYSLELAKKKAAPKGLTLADVKRLKERA